MGLSNANPASPPGTSFHGTAATYTLAVVPYLTFHLPSTAMALSIARKSTKETVMDKIRAASEELGEPLPTTKMNPKTGRPVRKSAGRKVAHPDFLDSAKVIDDDASDKGGDEDYDHEENARSKKKPKSKKRKRTPSPEPSRLSPEPYHDIRLPESSPAPEDRLTNSRPTPTSGTVNIVANIPLGFCGPLHITLDISDFLGAQKRRCTLGVGGLGVDFGLARGILSKPAQSSKCGFLTLPAGEFSVAVIRYVQ